MLKQKNKEEVLLIESEYKKIQETTNKYKKQKYWKISIGLNQVDDLKLSY